ncbi:hypothetical protein J1N35_020982 [Gossypium stocksii]|uniref:Uncharacterized protein n=1 Tax=Gossypium stocksii TaxID=47602 RepID=A0A9D3VDS5_9ROSI|nr:hypothetical protein J1N35_020982 [Gossypium stocksii]
MAMFYRMQMLLPAYALLLISFTLASSTITSSSKEEIKCDTCTPVSSPPPPPPVVTECPPPPSPPSPPPPSPPPPPNPSSPPPACPSCASPCSSCRPPPCPGCPSPPKQVVPYFIYSYKNPPPSESAATNAHSLLVSATLVIFWGTLSLFSN